MSQSLSPSQPARLLAGLLLALASGLLRGTAADQTPASPCGLCYAAGENDQRILVPLKSTQVALEVTPGLIEAQVIQTFTNDTATALEAIYLYPLPNGATLTDFELRFQDRVIRSVVREKQEARQTYEAAKAEGRKTALLEQHDPSLFSTAVANFLPGETVQVVIRFLQPLTLSTGAIDVRFPMVTGDKYFPADTVPGTPGAAAPNPVRNVGQAIASQHFYTFDVQVAGIPASAITSSSHKINVADLGDDRFSVSLADGGAIPDRDFLLRIEREAGAAVQPTLVTQDTASGDYGLLTVFPPVSRPVSAKVSRPRDVVFLLDHSGSMQGSRLENARLGLEGCLAMLRPDDRFCIAIFDDTFSFYRNEWIRAGDPMATDARDFVRKIQAGGGTRMQPALSACLDSFETNDHEQLLIFLTDGDVGNENTLFNLIEKKIGRVRLFAFGIGNAPNAALLTKMAELGHGQARFMNDDSVIIGELTDLFATLDAPVLSDLSLTLFDADGHPVDASLVPDKLSDVFLARPVQAVFRTTGNPVAVVQINGQVEGQPASLQIPVQSRPLTGDGIEKHFGHLWYEELAGDFRRAEGEDAKTAVRKKMLETALLFQLVTEQTSRVAVEDRVSRDPNAPLASQHVASNLPADQGGGEEVIVLSPFVVDASEDQNSYTATSTLAGTRVRTDLRDVASAISVVTKQFLQDTGARNQNDLLVYTPSTEVSGIRGNFSGMAGTGTYWENTIAATTRVRGLDAADNTRDYYLTDIPWDAFNLSRVDFQRGPNALLFGVGSPAGIINTSLNDAAFKTAFSLENRLGEYGSVRDSIDLNQELIRGILAIRVTAVDDDERYEQKPAFNNSKRVFAALRYDPRLLSADSHTSLRVKFESGSVSSNNPRQIPPDASWWLWFKTGANFPGHPTRPNVPGGIYYADVVLQDPRVFDFYKNLIDGPTKHEWQKWNAINATLEQSFFDDRLGLLVGFDHQHYTGGARELMGIGFAQTDPDVLGSSAGGGPIPDPEFTFTGDAWLAASLNCQKTVVRDTFRFAPTYELRAEDLLGNLTLAKILGRHIFTGCCEVSRVRTDNSSWAGDAADSSWALIGGANSAIPVADSGHPAVMDSASRWRFRDCSTGFTWQGYLASGDLVPAFGWRKDVITTYDTNAPTDPGSSSVNWNYPDDLQSRTDTHGESRTWGGVYHLPKFLTSELPGDTTLSFFYDRSGNFKADASRLTLAGTAMPKAVGQTTEYGVVITTLQDRLSLKVNWFKTSIANATLAETEGYSIGGLGGDSRFIADGPIWGWAWATTLQEGLRGNVPNSNIWDYAAADGLPHATPAQIAAYNDYNNQGGTFTDASGTSHTYVGGAAIVNAWLNAPFPSTFFASYHLSPAIDPTVAQRTGNLRDAYLGGVDVSGGAPLGGGLQFGNHQTTVNNRSQGTEVELNCQLVKNWNLALNYSHVHATHENIDPTSKAFVGAMTRFMNGPGGQVREWLNGGSTLGAQWDSCVAVPYTVLLNELGHAAPEVAPWRLNLISSYTIDHGLAKGLFFGGALRVEAGRIIGYAFDPNFKNVNSTDPDYAGVPNLGLGGLDINQPFIGKTEHHVDLWIGDSKKITRSINWRIQLNVRSVGEKDHLMASRINPDGSVALARIVQGMGWELTNSFDF